VTAAIVTVLVDGRIVDGSVPATLRGDVVVAPVWPYASGIAQRVECLKAGSLFFERDGRTFRVTIGSTFGRSGDATQALSIAPYLRAGEAIIPLAAVARALGASVAYDARARVLQIDIEPEPLATMTPYANWSPPPGPLPTFTAAPTPAPVATLRGVPSPRRTPLLVESGS
jgi:hypothetical protein